MLNKENSTPNNYSDLRGSHLTNNPLYNKSHIQNFDEHLHLNSNLSSIHVNNNKPHNLKSSLMGQSELQYSYLTSSNQPGT